MIRRMALTIGLTGAMASMASAATINVPGNSSTIQGGITLASNGDQVVVAPGTYNEIIDLLGKSITVRSSGGPHATIIRRPTSTNGSVITCDTMENNNTKIIGFTIENGNGTFGEGGGMFNMNTSPTVENCIFRNNTAVSGGGVYNFGGPPRFRNCLFYGNSATRGGGMYNEDVSPSVTNCTFSNNTASGTGNEWGGGIYSVGNSIPGFTNCIVWGNSPNQVDEDAGPVAIFNHSTVQGTTPPGTGNMNANPLFVNAGSNDYRLQFGSPCIDAGDSQAIASNVFVDLDLNPRGVDEPNTADAPASVAVFGLVVDFGAYEFPIDCNAPVTCPADLTGNSQVDVDDLLLLIGAWGGCP